MMKVEKGGVLDRRIDTCENSETKFSWNVT
jgi:hypothetical protein